MSLPDYPKMYSHHHNSGPHAQWEFLPLLSDKARRETLKLVKTEMPGLHSLRSKDMDRVCSGPARISLRRSASAIASNPHVLFCIPARLGEGVASFRLGGELAHLSMLPAQGDIDRTG